MDIFIHAGMFGVAAKASSVCVCVRVSVYLLSFEGHCFKKEKKKSDGVSDPRRPSAPVSPPLCLTNVLKHPNLHITTEQKMYVNVIRHLNR